MTGTAVGRQETPAGLLFGTAKKTPEAAAQRELSPHLRRNLGVLARLPKPLRDRAVAAIIATTLVLLNFNVIELLVDGWREHHDLTDAARHTLAKPGSTELVALASHSITVSQQPFIDLFLNGERVATVRLELTIQFDVSAAVAGVTAGIMTALHSGRCDITATLAIQGAEVIQRQKRIELPGFIALKEGIKLLREEDYAKARKVRTAVATEPVPGSSEPPTVRIAVIRSQEEGTRA